MALLTGFFLGTQLYGQPTFTPVTEGDIINPGPFSVGCAWGDYDNDGDQDLFVANGGREDVEAEKDFLYENNGDGTFT